MRKTAPAPSPDAYVAALDGWRRALAERLRAAIRLNAEHGHPAMSPTKEKAR